MIEGFRARIGAKQPLIGTFVKTPAPQLVEIFGLSGLDFVAIDAEHGPIDLVVLDLMAMAARAAGVPMMVRVPALDPAMINSVLDLGADGVILPHIRSAAEAARAAAAVKYAGTRGFSASTRAARYGAAAAGYRERADAETTLWCQVEDREALGHLDAIAAVPGVDCLFLGPADLALSLGLPSVSDPGLAAPRTALATACGRSRCAAGTFLADKGEIAATLRAGYSVIICGTDQAALLQAGRGLMAAKGA